MAVSPQLAALRSDESWPHRCLHDLLFVVPSGVVRFADCGSPRLDSIVYVQQQRAEGRAQPQTDLAIERLLMTLHEDVVPMLQTEVPVVGDRKDSMSVPVPAVHEVQQSHALTPSALYPNAMVPFDQESWDRWRSRGRAADAAFDRKLVVVSIVAAVILGVGSALWMWL